jgi:peptidyl-prolyl cis-trans isomerase A (cyclophilin A)
MKTKRVAIILVACAAVICVGITATRSQEEAKIVKEKAAAEKAPENMGTTILVRVETSLGAFTLELYKDKAPITVDNFIKYTEKKFYDGTIFHRIIPKFMIQGGGFTQQMIKKETAPAIKNEADNGLKNLKYTIAMARTNDVNSATSQFFINTKDNTFLDHSDKNFGYAVFGKVTEGTDVIDKIEQVKTGTKDNYENVPVKPVLINSVRLVKEEKPE